MRTDAMQASGAWDERGSASTRQLGQGLILFAAIVVGISIVSNGTLSRALNGLGAVGWVAGAALLFWSLRREPRAIMVSLLAVAAAVVLALLVRPSDLVGAIVGFGVGALIVALAASRHQPAWAMLVPAIYLPAHLLIAISRSILAGGTTIRTEPPPTAPVVPLVMVLIALVVGLAVRVTRGRIAD